MYYGGYGLHGFRMLWDPTYILVIVGVVLSLIASMKVKTTFNKYSRVRSTSGLTGAQVAQRILNYAGITDVSIGRVSGSLTDHYNPKSKVINLSESVYGSNSVAAIAVAAHECGHVIQHSKNYAPLSIRTALVPVANFGSGASWFVIIAGLIFSYHPLVTIGILLFSAAVLFQVVTLPVEFNASQRALVILQDTGILGMQEGKSAKKVLHAAALTYVASAAAAILQLLRLIMIFGRNNDQR
ncbi:MAG: zinc metallopeptidase [Eubacterium sp.]|nr:zinc metallopeptidase [Eubacterium sp.]